MDTPHSPPSSVPLLPFIALLIGGITIGFSGIFMRYSDVNPIASAFWRMAIAAPFLWIWALKQSPLPISGQQIHFTPVLAWAGFYFAGDLALWHSALHTTTVANATLLSNLAPICIALLMWKVYGTRFSRLFLMGLITALLGAIILVIGKPQNLIGNHNNTTQQTIGDALGLLSAFFYAGYQLSIKKGRHYYSTSRLMAWCTTLTALFLLPIALLSPGAFVPLHLNGWFPLICLAFITQIGGQTVIAYASAHLPTSLSSIGLLIQPLTAAVAAWILFNEHLSLLQIGGGILLLYGIYLSRKSSTKLLP